MNNPAIVVVAYNRALPLRRLLTSLQRAEYPNSDITLIISIDNSSVQLEIAKCANEFEWTHGTKIVLCHPEQLGLRNHILQSGDYAQEYGGVILLEDDLYVSPHFYSFAVESQQFLAHDDRIAGVSLYEHHYNETAKRGFLPRNDGFSNFFMQLPSSWGQTWTSAQWRRFRDWYELNRDIPITADSGVPADVAIWPESSWKKYFIRYMIANDLYFSFPHASLTTNFMDPGTHHKTKYCHLQRPLQQTPIDYQFASLDISETVYDAHCELLPHLIAKVRPDLSAYCDDLTVDLYGVKPLSELTSRYILTSKKTHAPIKCWGRNLLPHESNIFCDVDGTELNLSQSADCTGPDQIGFFAEANYYHGLSPQLYQLETSRYESNFNRIMRDPERKLDDLTRELGLRDETIRSLLSSTSWKLTKPLRWSKSILSRK
jgi:hypothetical protein